MIARYVLAAVCIVEGAARADDIPEVPHRSEAVATALSVAGTVLPIATLTLAFQFHGNDRAINPLLVTSAIVGAYGPSLGNAYAGDPLTRGLGMRLAGGLAFTVGVSMGFVHLFDDHDPGRSGAATLFGVAGIGLYAGGALYDILTASRDAREFNDAHAPQIQVMPFVGAHASGVAFGTTF